MLKDEKIKIFISYRNFTHYIKLGYEPILNRFLEVKTNHLPSSSHVKVTAICEICNVENIIIYDKYLRNKERHGFYGCRACSRQKAALSSLKKYGVDNYSKTSEWKERVTKTNMEKYGYKTNLISPEYKDIIQKRLFEIYGTDKHWEIRKKRKKFKLKNIDLIIDQTISYSEDSYDDSILLNEYHRYRCECRRLTNKNLKILLESWDGYDYYDGEFIGDNFELPHNDFNYPTIDHKKSIYWGYNNNIDKILISDISNLCITKRSINSKKRDLTEEEFKLIS